MISIHHHENSMVPQNTNLTNKNRKKNPRHLIKALPLRLQKHERRICIKPSSGTHADQASSTCMSTPRGCRRPNSHRRVRYTFNINKIRTQAQYLGIKTSHMDIHIHSLISIITCGLIQSTNILILKSSTQNITSIHIIILSPNQIYITFTPLHHHQISHEHTQSFTHLHIYSNTRLSHRLLCMLCFRHDSICLWYRFGYRSYVTE